MPSVTRISGKWRFWRGFEGGLSFELDGNRHKWTRLDPDVQDVRAATHRAILCVMLVGAAGRVDRRLVLRAAGGAQVGHIDQGFHGSR